MKPEEIIEKLKHYWWIAFDEGLATESEKEFDSMVESLSQAEAVSLRHELEKMKADLLTLKSQFDWYRRTH